METISQAPTMETAPQTAERREEIYPTEVYRRLESQLSTIRQRIFRAAGNIAAKRQPEGEVCRVNFQDQDVASHLVMSEPEQLLRDVGLVVVSCDAQEASAVAAAPSRNEDYPLNVYRCLCGQMQCIRTVVMALAAEKAQKHQPVGPYTITVEDQDEALREILNRPAQVHEIMGLQTAA